MPDHRLWLAAAGAGEFNFWILLIAAAGLISGTLGYFLKSKICQIPAVLSGIMLLLMLSLTAQIVATANQYGARLSLWQELFGELLPDSPAHEEFGITFANRAGKQLKLDVYTAINQPAEQSHSGKLDPSVIIVHGGSWSRGKRSECKKFDRWLAAQHYVVFDIDYRLATNACHFPAQLDDVEAALDWVQKHGCEYRCDPKQTFLLGRSAGAQLALVTAYRNPLRVLGVISYYAPTDLTWDYKNPCIPDVIETRPTLENYLGGTPDTVPNVFKDASPTDALTKEGPGTLIFQGGHDQVVDKQNAKLLIAKLEEKHVPYTYVYLPWANHGFDFRLNGWSSQITRAVLSSFLESTLARDSKAKRL
jgi:acetyl esterase/lipase